MSLRTVGGEVARYVLDALQPRRRALRELKARWGQPGEGGNWYAREHFDWLRGDSDAIVDDKTWADLEFPRLFDRLDVAVTPIGSQVLFRQMRTYAAETGQPAARFASYARFRSDPALREALQRRLLPLQGDANARITDFIFGELPRPLHHAMWFGVWSIASVLVLVAAAAWSWFIWLWLAMVGTNVVLLARNARGVVRNTETLRGCVRLMRVADGLAGLRTRWPAVAEFATLAEEAENRAAVGKALRWIAFLDALHQSPLDPVPVLNFAFLVELRAQVRAIKQFAALRQLLARSFELVGALDAALAAASWLEGHPAYCLPRIVDRTYLDIRDGCHPLLVGAVANSLCLDARSLLVTGSNMAGKTTFIKLLGTNAILGQTLGFCTARAATLPRACVRASIHNAHSVASGKSHYRAEVDTIRGFLAEQAADRRTLLVIDEPFSGTNTTERIAIARAVLEALGHHSLVLATTHDVELQAALAGEYLLCHFQEDPAVDGYFDYRLRPGPATERNAIRLLGELGYPDAIVERALGYAEAEGAEADIA